MLDFVEAATKDGLIEKMNPVKRDQILAFDREYREWRKPSDSMRDYRLAKAPMDAVFARTRELTTAAIASLESWTGAEGGRMHLEAATGAWVLGEVNEDQDLAKLLRFTAAFAKHFGATGLPPSLRKEAVQKQEAAHLEARAKYPPTPPIQKLSELRGNARDISSDGEAAFLAFHDFLDGYFGVRGDEAFTQKAKYAYDRRVGRSGKGKKKDKTEAKGKTDGKDNADGKDKNGDELKPTGTTSPAPREGSGE